MTSESVMTIHPRIAVAGIGGAGCNIVSEFYNSASTVDTIAINTDKQALADSSADCKLYICKEVTKGKGTQGDARLGKKCAKIHEEEIETALRGHDAVFIIAGLGGGTGTGALPVVADIANRLGMMTFVIGINPFFFESGRQEIATCGIRSVRAVCPNTFVVENDKVLELMPEATMEDGMRFINRSIIGNVGKIMSDMAGYMKEEIETFKPEVKDSGRQETINFVSVTSKV